MQAGRGCKALDLELRERCIAVCRQALAEAGIFLRAPGELSTAQRDYLRTYFRSTVFPYLTPRAITATPGLSFPLIPDLTLCMVVMARGPHAGAARHIGDLVVPAAVPRFVRLPDSDDFVALEDVIRHELVGRIVERTSSRALTHTWYHPRSASCRSLGGDTVM